MSLIRFNNVHKSYDERSVLREVFFRLEDGERVGLIGKNGAGKTTALRLILGQEAPEVGTLELEPGLRVGYFSQFSELSGDLTVEQTLDALFAPIHTLEAELAALGHAIEAAPTPEAMDRLLARQAQVLDALEHAGGWTYHNQIDTVLTRLGFSPEHRTRPIDQLSGGWRNRAALARILLEAPDVLLLDEPTNFLDLAGLTWLEDWLNSFRGGVILVSHDRHFLDRVATRIIEIENYHFQEYQGGFTQYVREKPLRQKTLERQFEHEAELLALEAEAISERAEMLKNPTQALKRRLANIKKELKPRLLDQIITSIYAGLYVPNDVLLVEQLGKAYDRQVIFEGLNLEVHRGDRIAVIGANGCGKSTLLRVLAEEEAPDEGRVAWAKGGSYVSFNQVFEELDPKDTVTHAVNVTGLAYVESRKAVNRFLGLLQFSEMDLYQRIGTLSGGQKARVALAKALLSGASCILLDEPTNHLDLTSTQVMERALASFPGAVIVVSHDRFFIDKVATRLLIFRGAGRIESIWGSWSTWQAQGG